MKHFAKYFSIYIYTGSFIHKENKQLYNVGSIIDPNGSIICTQRKVHLTDFEDNIGLARGNQFDVLEAPIGKIAAPVCMDADRKSTRLNSSHVAISYAVFCL